MVQDLILHIGHGKTGTSTLQRTLVASQSVLAGKGILHPSTAPHKHNHKPLIPRLLTPSDQSSGDTTANAQWNLTQSQIEQIKPHTLILSSEQLFRPWAPEQLTNLVQNLRSIAQHITVVAYIREPAGLALSTLQQSMKSRAFPATGLKLLNPRAVLEGYEKAGFDAVQVRAFDRKTLAGGSVIQDFFETALPDVDLADLVMTPDENTSMSAEAMSVLQDIHSGKRRLLIGKPRREVRDADQRLKGFTRPKLLPHMRDAIRASYDHYHWLREEYGVTFSGFDLPDMKPSDARKVLDQAKAIEDICPVDADRKSALWRDLNKPIAVARRLFKPA